MTQDNQSHDVPHETPQDAVQDSSQDAALSKVDLLEQSFDGEGEQAESFAPLPETAPKVFSQTPLTDEVTALRLMEAILFASPEPVTKSMLEAQLGAGVDIADLLGKLAARYQDRGVNLVETDGQWSFRTATDLASMLTITKQPRRKLPRAAAEVLAIIAYHQPVTRAEIESIRGVETSKGTLDMLLELDWIKPGKRREVPGRPLTWKTTPAFLSHFNLASLNDLPGLEDLKASGLLDARPTQTFAPQDSVQGLADTTLEE